MAGRRPGRADYDFARLAAGFGAAFLVSAFTAGFAAPEAPPDRAFGSFGRVLPNEPA